MYLPIGCSHYNIWKSILSPLCPVPHCKKRSKTPANVTQQKGAKIPVFIDLCDTSANISPVAAEAGRAVSFSIERTGPMKIVICGAGQMGRLHLETFSAIDGVTIAAVADPDPERTGALAEKGIRTFGDGDEMLATVKADVAVIATPTAFHAPLAIRAFEKGMHVFCEKPMARNLADGQAMVKAAEKAGRKLAVGYVLRFHDAYILAHDYIADAKLGRIGTVRTSRCAENPQAWTRDIEAHGGAVFELLTHDLDWLTWSLGGVKRIFARGLAKGKAKVERDYCLVVVRFENGVIGHLEGSLAEVGESYASYEIAGSGGLLAYDTRKSSVLEARLITSEGLRSSSETPRNERPFAREIHAFVEVLERDSAFEIFPQEALETLRLTSAVFESVRSGQPVEL